MSLKTLFAMAAAAVGGIYLTSEEGKKAREALQKKKSTFEPIIKDLLVQAGEVLEGSKKINSDEVRANVETLVNEAKKTLIDLDLEKAADGIKAAIKVASEKLRVASNETKKKSIKKSPVKTTITKK